MGGTTDSEERDRERRPLSPSIETAWRMRLGERVVNCTIHRTDEDGFAVLARTDAGDALRVGYAQSVDAAHGVAEEWRTALLTSGFNDLHRVGANQDA